MFLTTKNPVSTYNLIINSCRFNAEKRLGKKLEINVIKYKKLPEIKFLFFICSYLFSGKIFSKESRIYLKFANIEIGRFITASVFKDIKSYESKFHFYINYIKYLYKAGIMIRSSTYYLKNIKFDCIYIDHCGYLNGIIYTVFVKKKLIYTNNYPKNIFLTHKSSFDTYEKNLRIRKDKTQNNKKIINKAIFFLNKLIRKPETIPWLVHAVFNDLKKIPNIKEYEYIIYTHAFTDGQLWFGNDGFENSHDWLDFTLKTLKALNKKVLIKCHPNYFNKFYGNAAIQDNKIFRNIYSKYKDIKNFYFIKQPVLNSAIMSQINKNCIAITHHGNVIFELAHSNFKIIASKAKFFAEDYKITNNWDSPRQYSSLLNKPHYKLKHANKKDLYNLVDDLFFDLKGFYSKNTINSLSGKYLDEKSRKAIMTNSLFNNVSEKMFDKHMSNIVKEKICRIVAKNISC